MDAGGDTGISKLVKLLKRRLIAPAEQMPYDIAALSEIDPTPLMNKRHLITIGTGRCGMRWLTRFFARHDNCYGIAERFADYDAFYRWITWNGIDVDMSGYFELLRRAAWHDLQKFDVTIYTGHYLVFALAAACRELKPTHLIHMIREPEAVVNSLYVKGWYCGDPQRGEGDRPLGPQPLQSPPISRSLGRIVPRGDAYEPWSRLSRIGKIAWFYVMMNESILAQLPALAGVDVWCVKLSDLDQNYDYYQTLATAFGLSPLLSRSEFLAVKETVENRGKTRRSVSDWSPEEKRDFERIVGPFRPIYDQLKSTNI